MKISMILIAILSKAIAAMISIRPLRTTPTRASMMGGMPEITSAQKSERVVYLFKREKRMSGKAALMMMLNAIPRMVANLGFFGAAPVFSRETLDIVETPLVQTRTNKELKSV
jgi:16S rRNA G1207 methylase RsmC